MTANKLRNSANFPMFSKKKLPFLLSVTRSGSKSLSENLSYRRMLSFVELVLGKNAFQKVDSLRQFESMIAGSELYFVRRRAGGFGLI